MDNLIEVYPTANEYASTPCVDAGTREAVGPLGRIGLSPAQYELLVALAKLPSRYVLTRADIVALIYGEKQRPAWLSYAGSVDALVRRLNDKLRAVGFEHSVVRAARGHGYRLEVGAQYLLRRETAS